VTDHQNVSKRFVSLEEQTRIQLAVHLRVFVGSGMNTLYADLLSGVIGDVNWQELARALLDE